MITSCGCNDGDAGVVFVSVDSLAVGDSGARSIVNNISAVQRG